MTSAGEVCRIGGCGRVLRGWTSATGMCRAHFDAYKEPPLCVCALPDVTPAGIANLPAGAECGICQRPFYGYADPLRDEWRAYLGTATSNHG